MLRHELEDLPESIPTPLVDAEASDGFSGDAMCVTKEFAQKLERKLWQEQEYTKRLRGYLSELNGRIAALSD